MKLKSLLVRIASGVSLLVLLGNSSVALAQTVIDGGQTVIVPGSQTSPWNIADDLFIGDTGSGTLEITSGGVVSNIGGVIGNASGSTGLVTIGGSGAQWTNSGSLVVGSQGSGTLEITDGAIVSNTGAYIADLSPDSTGSVTISGTGSQWINSGDLFVGVQGSGTLEIRDGAIVSNAFGYIAYLPGGSTGVVTVSGTGSQWINSDWLYVGTSGSGRLDITGGGFVSNIDARIGANTGYTGLATVSGAGSQWNSSGTLYVGYNGNGTLEITDGGLVSSAAGVLSAGSSSISTATVSGAGSQWVNSGSLSVGDRGRGTLEITGGATVSNMDGYIGNQSVGTGIVTVSGSGSHWDNSGDLAVGASGEGSLIITDSGIVSDVIGIVGYQPGATGTVTVSGAGSQWNNSFNLLIGFAGEGSLIITDGGIVSDVNAVVGYQSGSTGMVTVSGVGSQWNNTGGMAVGGTGNGVLQVTGGGAVSSPFGFVGYDVTGTGVVTIDGTGSQWSNAGLFYIGYLGTGTLAVANQGDIVASDIILADDAASRGILAIGALPGSAPTAPGTASAASIQFGAGTGTIVFNHTSSNYVFDATLNGGADNAPGSGTGLVGSGPIQAIAGRTILNSGHGDFTGTLQVSGTGILQVNGDVSGGTTDILAGGTLEGNGIVGTTANAGTISPGASIGALTISGNYTGNGGVLAIETVLGDDNSPTDRLIITGDVSGTTTVRVTNLGGSGAQTLNGIQIVRIGGISPDNAFSLSGDYVTETGRQAVIGGAYAYTLQHGGMETPADGNWYLVSEMTVAEGETPRYQPGVPLYEQYPQVLASLNTLPTLQQRVGNRYWQMGGLTAGNGANTVDTYGMWGRVEGSRTESEAARSTTFAHRSTDLWKLQTGFDFVLREGQNGLLVGGVNVSYGTALSEIGSPYGRGKIDATGTGIGATLTWYDANGFYVDGQMQAMWFDSDITSMTIGRREVSGNNGHGLAVSGETGYRYQLGNGFSLTPQAQLVWSQVHFDSFTDPYGARVSLQDGDSLRGRLGLSLDYEKRFTAADGTTSRAHVYGIVNLYNEFLDGSKVRVENVSFRSRDERLWAGLGLGGTYEWNNGRYGVYGNVNLAGSTSQMSDNHSLGGIVGFRAMW